MDNSLEIYISLYLALFRDIASCYPSSNNDTVRDEQRIVQRIRDEGFSFLTKTLPKIGKALDGALAGLTPITFPNLSNEKENEIPKFFGFLLSRVLSDDGQSIRSDADIVAIQHLRQLAYFMYKLELPYDQETEKSVLDSFVAVDSSLPTGCEGWPEVILNSARALITRVCHGFDALDIKPAHGPGSVATGENVVEKSRFRRLYKSLEACYPFTGYMHLSVSHTCDSLQELQDLEVIDEPTAKVVLVPKDSRGPRLISSEPLEIQWIQQGIARKLVPWIERHQLTRGFVNFTDQGINRRLALEASRTAEFATLDMKDASDRVSLELVTQLFQGTSVLRSLLASRSTRTRLPDGRIVELKKFAPMGSALCFPAESLCFWALTVSVLRHVCGFSWHKAKRSVYVYGDDLIIPSNCYAGVMQILPLFGLLFNEGKCCVSGFFRESCGCDAYKGVDVTPIKMKKTWSSSSRTGTSKLPSMVSLSNSLYVRGYYAAAKLVEETVERLFGALPYFSLEDPSHLVDFLDLDPTGTNPSGSVIGSDQARSLVLGFYRYGDHRIRNKQKRIKTRFSSTLHRYECFGYTVRPVLVKARDDGWEDVLRVLACGRTGQPAGTYAVARRSRLKRAWGSMS